MALKESGFNQKEVLNWRGLSIRGHRRAQAAAVPQIDFSVPIQSELSFSDYKILLGFNEKLSEKGLTSGRAVPVMESARAANFGDYGGQTTNRGRILVFSGLSGT